MLIWGGRGQRARATLQYLFHARRSTVTAITLTPSLSPGYSLWPLPRRTCQYVCRWTMNQPSQPGMRFIHAAKPMPINDGFKKSVPTGATTTLTMRVMKWLLSRITGDAAPRLRSDAYLFSIAGQLRVTGKSLDPQAGAWMVGDCRFVTAEGSRSATLLDRQSYDHRFWHLQHVW